MEGPPGVATEPMESIQHGKFWYLTRPLGSTHLKISADADVVTKSNPKKRLPDVLIFNLLF
jgi:hypothetical protein